MLRNGSLCHALRHLYCFTHFQITHGSTLSVAVWDHAFACAMMLADAHWCTPLVWLHVRRFDGLRAVLQGRH